MTNKVDRDVRWARRCGVSELRMSSKFTLN
jgi:hypothetical protein